MRAHWFDLSVEGLGDLEMTKQAMPALQAEVEHAKRLIASLTPEEWAMPSDCAGWRVQDVVCHMASVYETIAVPGSLPSDPGGDAERSAELAIEQRRDWTSEQVAAAYNEWSEKGVAALASMQDPPMADMVIPLGNLGNHPMHILGNAIVFDHYCHMRHDILEPGGPVRRDPLPQEDATLRAIVDWMLTGLPQMCADGLKVVDRPLKLVLEGPGASAWTIAPGGDLVTITAGDAGDAAATIRSSAHDFVSWGTKRRDWRTMEVRIEGDEGYATAVLEGVNVI
ncbi:MAG TPA: maleylpyruvate isomerase family mycothiol-dependent enzyme [Acidimicrobiales bacterium]